MDDLDVARAGASLITTMYAHALRDEEKGKRFGEAADALGATVLASLSKSFGVKELGGSTDASHALDVPLVALESVLTVARTLTAGSSTTPASSGAGAEESKQQEEPMPSVGKEGAWLQVSEKLTELALRFATSSTSMDDRSTDALLRSEFAEIDPGSWPVTGSIRPDEVPLLCDTNLARPANMVPVLKCRAGDGSVRCIRSSLAAQIAAAQLMLAPSADSTDSKVLTDAGVTPHRHGVAAGLGGGAIEAKLGVTSAVHGESAVQFDLGTTCQIDAVNTVLRVYGEGRFQNGVQVQVALTEEPLQLQSSKAE